MKRQKLTYWERHDRDIAFVNFGFLLAIGLLVLAASLLLGSLIWQIFWPVGYEQFGERYF